MELTTIAAVAETKSLRMFPKVETFGNTRKLFVE